MNAITEMPAPIVFSDSAAAKVAELIDEEGNPDLKLRVFVQGGGCSGFSTVSPLMKSSTKTTPRWKKTACNC
jgi:Fe-S cluster assembly iron-binding protein IscA